VPGEAISIWATVANNSGVTLKQTRASLTEVSSRKFFPFWIHLSSPLSLLSPFWRVAIRDHHIQSEKKHLPVSSPHCTARSLQRGKREGGTTGKRPLLFFSLTQLHSRERPYLKMAEGGRRGKTTFTAASPACNGSPRERRLMIIYLASLTLRPCPTTSLRHRSHSKKNSY